MESVEIIMSCETKKEGVSLYYSESRCKAVFKTKDGETVDKMNFKKICTMDDFKEVLKDVPLNEENAEENGHYKDTYIHGRFYVVENGWWYYPLDKLDLEEYNCILAYVKGFEHESGGVDLDEMLGLNLTILYDLDFGKRLLSEVEDD